MKHSLSDYFPAGTAYFYGYPAGQKAKFLNTVPPEIEETVAARALVCAGDGIKVIAYPSSTMPSLWRLLQDELGLPLISRDQVLSLPAEITTEITGEARNLLIKDALKQMVAQGSLVMAQPFLDSDISDRFQIPPDLTVWLNDKDHMPEYIPAKYLPSKFSSYDNGQLFADSRVKFPLPCVIKVASASSGDGVRICQKQEDVIAAKTEFAHILEKIFVEEYVDAPHNFGIQFGIPHDRNEPIEIIGFNQQLTGDQGEFMGGIIDPQARFPVLEHVYKLLLDDVLPLVRKMGWYGIGGFDVLVDDKERFFIIDCNFRMTGMSAFLLKVKNNPIDKTIMSFSGTFQGTEQDFRQKIVPLAKAGPNKIMSIIAVTMRDNCFQLNAGVHYEDQAAKERNCTILRSAGIESSLLA